jgi:hypothetical protein
MLSASALIQTKGGAEGVFFQDIGITSLKT